jgi:hypothetical protein
MKCPVCSKGEITYVENVSPNADINGNHYTRYFPHCNNRLCAFSGRGFDSIGEAEEAMRPVVSDELVKKIQQIFGVFWEDAHYMVSMFNETNPQSVFIKQELEKF